MCFVSKQKLYYHLHFLDYLYRYIYIIYIDKNYIIVFTFPINFVPDKIPSVAKSVKKLLSNQNLVHRYRDIECCVRYISITQSDIEFSVLAIFLDSRLEKVVSS